MAKEKVQAAKNKALYQWQTLHGPYKTAIIVLLLAVAWMVSGVFSTSDDGPDAGSVQANQHMIPRVRVTTVNAEQHTKSITVLGRIQADEAVVLKAQVLGHVLDVVANKGDHVNVGDVILHLDPEDRAGRLAEAKARLTQQKIAYEAARKLRKGGYSSQLTVAQTKADVEAARAQVTRMKRDLDNSTVTAPIAGVIDTLSVKTGDYFDKAGGVLGRIVNLSNMVALGQVAERNINDIALGKIATVRLPDGRELSGEVTYIASTSEALTRTFAVEVSLQVADGSVREGITAEIKLPMATALAHHITPALLTLDGNGDVGVKVVTADNTVEFRRVQIVSDSQDGMWLSGLAPQIHIISVGQEFVNVGQTVVPIEGRIDARRPQPVAKE